METVAIILDGGFVTKKLAASLKREPTADDIEALCTAIMAHDRMKDCRLLRAFYYDAEPFEGSAVNPLSRVSTNFAVSKTAIRGRALLEALELKPDFAVRRGELALHGWKLGRAAQMDLKKASRPIVAADLVPAMEQKQVDLKIGLDVALVALKRIASVIVIVSGDSDLVPVMKFARREGAKVYLQALGHGVRREMKVHADLVL